MDLKGIIDVVNRMKAAGVIDEYAIGGAVGATFYLEPISTQDLDIFVTFRSDPASLLVDPQPIFDYLKLHGGTIEGEYVMIADWPVQFLPPTGPLVEEALAEAVEENVEGTTARVFTAEHLAAIALETGRAKDKARLVQFIESGVLDTARFEDVLGRHGLVETWRRVKRLLLDETP